MESRRADSARNHERLLQAGREAFAVGGFAGTSIGDVADRAGVTRGTFYQHFASKTELVCAVGNQVVASATPAWGEMDDALSAGSRDGVRRWLTSAIAWWVDNADILPTLREAAFVESEVTEVLTVAFSTMMSERIDCTADCGLKVALQLLILQLDVAIVDWLPISEDNSARDVLIDRVTDIWMASVGTEGLCPHRCATSIAFSRAAG